jgi:imidazole glycerol phosphate synthase glutamine amidotransferase subunit
MNLLLVDHGAGNVTSVQRALHRLGAAPQRTTAHDSLATADAIILPGVGHYAALIRALDERQLRHPLVAAIQRGVPFLGICLGLQALFQSSEEAPELAGLNLLPGRVCLLPRDVKLPHMGWNQLQFTRPSRLLANISADAFFYFAHSFAATDTNGEAVALCTYGAAFAAVIEHKNIHATQFHPEKSGAPGSQLLKNFLAGCAT